MLRNFLFTTLLCALLPIFGWNQSTDVLVERLHRQIEKAKFNDGQYAAWLLARFGYTYLAPEHPAMQRLYYETYYLPEEDFYDEDEILENGFSASDWSPNGKQLAVATSADDIRIYDTGDFSKYQTIQVGDTGALAIAYSPDSKLLAYGGSGNTLFITEVTTGKIIQQWTLADYIRAVAWSPDGKYIAAGGDESTIYLYELERTSPIHIMNGHADWIRGLSFSQDGQLLAAASDDATATVWSVSTGQVLRTHRDHEDYCRDVVFNPNGQDLLTVSDDLNAYIYRPGDANKPTESFKFHPDWIMAADWSANGRLIATADQAGLIAIHDLKQETQEYLNAVELETSWIDIDLSPNNRLLVATSLGEISIYELGKSTPIHRIMLNGEQAALRNQSIEHVLSEVLRSAIQIHPSPDGKKLAVIDANWLVQVVDLDTKKISYSITDHEDWIRDVSWSPDGRYLATASDDMMVGIWDANDGSMLHFLSRHTDWVRSVEFSPDSQVLLSSGDDGTIYVWDPGTGTELAFTESINLYLLMVKWSPNQAYFAAVDSEQRIQIYSTRNNARVDSSDFSIIPSTLHWTDDNTLLATKENNESIAWTSSGFGPSDDTRGKIYTTNPKGIVATTKENFILLDKPKARLLEGHTALVTHLEWSPTGTFLISQASNGELGIWSSTQHTPLAILELPNTGIMGNKYLVWQENDDFFVPGLNKIVVLPPNLPAPEAGNLDLSTELIQAYDLFNLVRANEVILERIVNGEDTNLKTLFAALFEKRATANPDTVAAAKDRAVAERLKTNK